MRYYPQKEQASPAPLRPRHSWGLFYLPHATIMGMRTTSAWAMWRRAQYYGAFAAIFIIIAGWVYLANFRAEPTCFDGKQNSDEVGIDCGGSCVRICALAVTPPATNWARAFKVTDGVYNAVAYVVNTNREAASMSVNYTFTLYDNAGLITERSGTTVLPPDGEYPIFEGRIDTGRRVPTNTFIELEEPEVWQPATIGRDQFTVSKRELTGADERPRLDATIKNTSLEEAKEVEVVATIFDASGIALATSRTFIENFSARSEREVTFTWPEPIAKTLRSCEVPSDVMVLIDVSGSMNNDQTNPPQPLTAVKDAAARFVSRLGDNDQVSVSTFASDASVLSPLSLSGANAVSVINSLAIKPVEETGTTNTAEGISVAANELLSVRHNANARKVLILLTDGLATAPGTNEEAASSALLNASATKDAGINIYTIGLGEEVNMDFLRNVASVPEQAYQALDKTKVDNIYQTITSAICEDGPAVIDIVAKSTAGFVPLTE